MSLGSLDLLRSSSVIRFTDIVPAGSVQAREVTLKKVSGHRDGGRGVSVGYLGDLGSIYIYRQQDNRWRLGHGTTGQKVEMADWIEPGED